MTRDVDMPERDEDVREEPVRDEQIRDEQVRDARQEPEDESGSGLFASERAAELRARWTDVQAQFVDDPKAAVKAADGLVEEVLRDLAALFTDERDRLGDQLGAKQRLETEQLRIAIRRYRAFFEKLLAV